MTKQEYYELIESELNNIANVIKQKNTDYSGGSDDPFANFKMGEILGIASAEQGVLLRMLDKIQRLKSFYTNGELKVKSESHVDALRDIIGYSLILIGLSKEDNGKPKLPKS